MEFKVERYISGHAAIYLHKYGELLRGIPGGPCRVFSERDFFGEHDPEKNTLPILGMFGLQEASAWLRHLGYEIPKERQFFVADRMRAALDIIFFIDAMGKKPKPFLSEKLVSHEWQKEELLFYAERMAENSARLWEWIKFERENSRWCHGRG